MVEETFRFNPKSQINLVHHGGNRPTIQNHLKAYQISFCNFESVNFEFRWAVVVQYRVNKLPIPNQ
ncbi:hypothetical protein CDG76_18960 [Nostoc sp. 'Peltigera membranacea cyanobiont' 210A]|nr:hypothetical protein CDG76_18960 [Nostoc sp. 'Peltigera membranacea cyanobiont' 210A]